MSNLKRRLAAATAVALLPLPLPLMPAAQAHQGHTGHKQTYSQPATGNRSATGGTRTWPASAPDQNSSNGG